MKKNKCFATTVGQNFGLASFVACKALLLFVTDQRVAPILHMKAYTDMDSKRAYISNGFIIFNKKCHHK